MTLNLEAYCARIGLPALPAADLAGLSMLIRAHRFAIPFENLDIPLGRGISLDPDAVFRKLVTDKRGGYCFEQNQLFRRVLQAAGFEARQLMARVWLMAEGVPPRTHTLVLVRLNGKDWIADAGFGGGLLPLMPLDADAVIETPDGAAHRLRTTDGAWLLQRRSGENPWQDQYSFTLDHVEDADLEMGNHWTATRPGTRFTLLRIVSLPGATGFTALTGRALGGPAPEEIADAGRYRDVLAEKFGIELTAAEVDQLDLF